MAQAHRRPARTGPPNTLCSARAIDAALAERKRRMLVALGSAFEQVRRAGVAERVGRHVPLDAGGACGGPDGLGRRLA